MVREKGRYREKEKKQVDARFIYTLSRFYLRVWNDAWASVEGAPPQAHITGFVCLSHFAAHIYTCIKSWHRQMKLYIICMLSVWVPVWVSERVCEEYKTQPINITGYYRNRIRRKVRCYMSRTLSMVLVASQQLPSYILFA